jgi:hypothetical protein
MKRHRLGRDGQRLLLALGLLVVVVASWFGAISEIFGTLVVLAYAGYGLIVAVRRRSAARSAARGASNGVKPS